MFFILAACIVGDGIKINSHEIAISYQFETWLPTKRFKHILDCPEF